MRKGGAALGSLLFLVLAPGTTAILIPWLVTRWEVRVPPPSSAIRALGLGLIGAGAAVLFDAFARFVLEGRGTPAPLAPTERLVVRGLYRHVRNPMYLAVTATIVGQTLFFGRWVLLAYAAFFLGTTAAFVRWYEEPTLRDRSGPSTRPTDVRSGAGGHASSRGGLLWRSTHPPAPLTRDSGEACHRASGQ